LIGTNYYFIVLCYFEVIFAPQYILRQRVQWVQSWHVIRSQYVYYLNSNNIHLSQTTILIMHLVLAAYPTTIWNNVEGWWMVSDYHIILITCCLDIFDHLSKLELSLISQSYKNYDIIPTRWDTKALVIFKYL